MPAYPWTSVYLLGQLKRLIGRSGIADAVTNASYYERLTEAQAAIVTDIAGIFPSCLYPTVAYGSIPTLTTTDSKNYSFGTDSNGFAIAPMGKATLYRSLDDIPTNPMIQGVDFIPLGGTMIQMPNDSTGPATIYARFITPPGVLSDTTTTQPILFPETSRALIAYRAAIEFLTEGGRNLDLADRYRLYYGRPMHPFVPGLFASHMLQWETAWRGGGALGSRVTGMMVAVGSQFGAG